MMAIEASAVTVTTSAAVLWRAPPEHARHRGERRGEHGGEDERQDDDGHLDRREDADPHESDADEDPPAPLGEPVEPDGDGPRALALIGDGRLTRRGDLQHRDDGTRGDRDGGEDRHREDEAGEPGDGRPDRERDEHDRRVDVDGRARECAPHEARLRDVRDEDEHEERGGRSGPAEPRVTSRRMRDVTIPPR